MTIEMPLTVLVVRVLVMTWLLVLTSALLAYGSWGWALLPAAGAGGHLWYLVRGQGLRACGCHARR
ncbi:MAG TPA: hypothetical protein VGJ14_07190 [Sporichthyaceae bacterium]